jgi:MoaA/NifB/PqqE/SkfB family radical SAM enzyme
MNRYLCQIELTYQCDQYCTYCYKKHPDFSTVSNLLSPSQWVAIGRTFDAQVFNACLISGGEPSCITNLLLDVLEELPSSLAQVSILTNGSRFDYKTICQLKQTRDDITFQLSLDGITQKAHELNRQTPHSWEKALECSLILNKLGVRYSFSTVVSNHNFLQVPYIIKVAYALGANQIHLAEELCWKPSSTGFAPSLSCEQRIILEQLVRSAQHEWAGLLDCYPKRCKKIAIA